MDMYTHIWMKDHFSLATIVNPTTLISRLKAVFAWPYTGKSGIQCFCKGVGMPYFCLAESERQAIPCTDQ